MENIFFKKDLIKFKQPIDFNYISKLLNNNNLNSYLQNEWSNQYVLNSTFRISNIQDDKDFLELFDYLNENYNKENDRSNLYFFLSFKLGSTGIKHFDNYDVIIIGAYGETIYNLEGKEYRVCVGDLLKIPKYVKHTAISMTPRIVLSYGKYN